MSAPRRPRRVSGESSAEKAALEAWMGSLDLAGDGTLVELTKDEIFSLATQHHEAVGNRLDDTEQESLVFRPPMISGAASAHPHIELVRKTGGDRKVLYTLQLRKDSPSDAAGENNADKSPRRLRSPGRYDHEVRSSYIHPQLF